MDLALNNLEWFMCHKTKPNQNKTKQKKARSRRYPAETMTDADYADDLALFLYTPAQAESLLHSLEHAAEGISFYGNTNKTWLMCLKQGGAISTLSGKSLKFIDKFAYLSSNISSTESDINIRLAKM